MSRGLRLCSLLTVALLALAGCGSGGGDGAQDGTPKGNSGTTVDITFKGDTVKPQGAKVEVEAGKPVTLHVVADKAGELHVHSSPEQQIAYRAGTTDKTITIKQPGVVDVESHDLDRLVVQLEVR